MLYVQMNSEISTVQRFWRELMLRSVVFLTRVKKKLYLLLPLRRIPPISDRRAIHPDKQYAWTLIWLYQLHSLWLLHPSNRHVLGSPRIPPEYQTPFPMRSFSRLHWNVCVRKVHQQQLIDFRKKIVIAFLPNFNQLPTYLPAEMSMHSFHREARSVFPVTIVVYCNWRLRSCSFK